MTEHRLLDELEGIVDYITNYPDTPLNGILIAQHCSVFLRTHHAEIADMAKRMETTERTLERCKQILDTTSEGWRLDAERLEAPERDAARYREMVSDYYLSNPSHMIDFVRPFVEQGRSWANREAWDKGIDWAIDAATQEDEE